VLSVSVVIANANILINVGFFITSIGIFPFGIHILIFFVFGVIVDFGFVISVVFFEGDMLL
jgi:hypothetical protein